MIVLGLIVLGRLSYIQIYRAAHYKVLSEKNRIVAKQTLPIRGNIYDVKGKIIAKNKFSYSAVLDISETPVEGRAKVISMLYKEKLLAKEKADELLKSDLSKINKTNKLILLQENMNWDMLSKCYIISSKIQGLSVERTQTREYLYPHAFAHILGYVGAPTKYDIQQIDSTVLWVPMAKIGKNGLEKTYNEELFGKAGIQHFEVNAKRQFVRYIDKIAAEPGEDIKLTINLNFQLKVYEILSRYESAACVVMNVNTGEILALVSYPGYDTNIFSQKIDSKTLLALYENPYKPIMNKVVSGLYSPGSVFKMITGLAGLQRGIIKENTRIKCDGVLEIGNHKFHCWAWKYGGHGYVNLQEALAQSCDVYFYNVAQMVSAETIANVANDLGLGVFTNIDMPDEKAGLIPTKAWKKKKKKQSWTTGDTINMSIGQGFVLATPLQLTKMIAMLANGMKPITPHLRKDSNFITKDTYNYNEKHIQILLEGMYDVVNSNYGTARRSAIEDDEFEYAGKTGSSQVFRITEQQRKLGRTVSEDYWKKEHAVFVGYAPVDDPQIAITVLIEHGGSGAHIAAPIARDILLAAKKYIKLRDKRD
jgi:penicillin-binding protein 2